MNDTDPPDRVTAATADEAKEARKTRHYAAEELDRVRATANSWRSGTAIGSALLAAAGIVGTPEALSAASPSTAARAGWLLAIASFLTVVALGTAMRASFGWPSSYELREPNSRRRHDEAEVRLTVVLLWISMISALIAACVIAGAFGMLFFGPRATPPAPSTSATPTMVGTPSPTP